MYLEVDAGNSRIKWRLVRQQGGRMVKQAEGAVVAWKKAPSVFIELGLQFDKLPIDQITRTRVSTVRGETFTAAFYSLMTERWKLEPEFARVERECAGVINAYHDVSTMGVDRWLAMLAAHASAGAACCIVDCGSAITVDLIAEDGQHQGGYIVPGLELMRDALGNKSRALQFVHTRQWQDTEPGMGTADAVINGILLMVVGMLEKVRASQESREIKWFLTGGDSDIVSRQVAWEHEVVPDLVLDGLSLALP